VGHGEQFARIILTTVFALAQSSALRPDQEFYSGRGANLKAKIESAIVSGRANAPESLLVAYQFEASPGAIDFESWKHACLYGWTARR